MIISPYEGVFLNKIPIDKTIQKLHLKRAAGQLVELTGFENDHDFTIHLLVENDESIPTFYQPVPTVDHNQLHIYLDARAYAGQLNVVDEKTQKQIYRVDALNLLIESAVLSGYWYDNPNLIMGLSTIPSNAYASLITEAMGRSFGLDHKTQFNCLVAFQTFYESKLLKSTMDFTAEAKLGLAKTLSSRAHIPMDVYMAVIDEMTPESIKDFYSIVNWVREQGWSPRLNRLSPKDVYSLVMNSWIGQQGNPRETVSAALEYPPIWVAICYRLCQSTFYQKLQLAQTLKRLDRGNELKSFVQRTARQLG